MTTKGVSAGVNPSGVDLRFLSELAQEAMAIQRRVYSSTGVPFSVKEDRTAVTEADLAINRMVIEEVRKVSRDVSILGEEYSDLTDSEYTLTVDPVDGTGPFRQGLQLSTVVLCLMRSGEPLLSVIGDTFAGAGQGCLYTAEKGQGARRDGKPLQVNGTTVPVGGPLVIRPDGSTPEIAVVAWPGCGYPLLAVAQRLTEMGFYAVNYNSIALCHTLVARGILEGVLFPSKNPHDSGAGDLLIREAGGRGSSLLGADQRYDRPIQGHLGSNGSLHPLLLDVIREVCGELSASEPTAAR